MSDQEMIIRAVREAQMVLAGYVGPGHRDCEATNNRLLAILDRSDIVAATDRVEDALGLRLPY